MVALAASCGGNDERPSSATWQGMWVSRQELVPTAAAIIEQREALCGERVGRFRTEMPALLPSPTEALDAAVSDWIAHAETIVFDCPTDPQLLADEFETLDLLRAEVDAGLAAEAGG